MVTNNMKYSFYRKKDLYNINYIGQPDTPAQQWPYLSMHMLDIDASTDTTYMSTCELCEPKTTQSLTSKKSDESDESPQNTFKSIPKLSKLFVKFNAGVPASAACERLFGVGKDAFSAKRNRLSDKNFERLFMCRVNK